MAPEGEKINQVTLSTDGRLAFLYHRKGSVRCQCVWVIGAKCLSPIMAPEGEKINQVTLSADGNLAFLCGGSREVQVYGVPEQKCLSPIVAQEGEKISQITLSADDRLAFLYRYESRKVQVYGIPEQKWLSPIVAPEGEKISQITLSADGSLAFLYDKRNGNRKVLIYECVHRQSLPVLRFAQPIRGVEVLPGLKDYTLLRSWYQVYLYHHKIREYTLICQINEMIELVKITDQQHLFVQCMTKNYLQTDCLEAEASPASILEAGEGHMASVSGQIKLSETNYVSSGTESYIWQVQVGQIVFLDKLQGNFNQGLVVDRGRLAFLYNDWDGSEVQVYGVPEQKLLSPIMAPEGEEINGIKLSADGRLAFLYNCRGSRKVQVYGVPEQELLSPIVVPEGKKIHQVTLSADSRLMFLYNQEDYNNEGGSHEVQIYGVPEQKWLASIVAPEEENIDQVTLSTDGRLAFLYNKDGSRKMQVYGIPEQKWLAPIVAPEEENIDQVTLSTDGRLAFLCGGGSREVQVYGMQEQKCLSPIMAPEGEKINQVTLSADGNLAFLCGGSREVQVYGVPEQKCLSPIVAPEGEKISQITLSADDRLAFLYRYESRKVQVYGIPEQKWLSPIQLPKQMEIEEFLFIPNPSDETSLSPSNTVPLVPSTVLTPEAKETNQNQHPPTHLVLYGSNGCFIWSSSTQKLISLITGSGITSAILLGHGAQLATSGADGVCRLWDITDLTKPLLKSCTRGMTLYAQGAYIDSNTDITPANRALLLRKGAVDPTVKQTEELQENKEIKSSLTSTSTPLTTSTTTTSSSATLSILPIDKAPVTSTTPPERKIDVDKGSDMQTSITALTTPGHTLATFKQVADPSSSSFSSSSPASIPSSASSSSSSSASTYSPHLMAPPSPKKLDQSSNSTLSSSSTSSFSSSGSSS